MRLGTFLIGSSYLLSRILGVVRDNLLAAGFGARGGAGIFNLDTYYAAFRLPDLLFNLLSYGMLSVAFIPLFVEIMKKDGRDEAYKFTNEILKTFCALISALSIILFIFAPYIVKVFVPGFAETDIATTISLTRIMLLTPLFFTAGSVFGGVQNALHKYLGLALAPIFYNIGIVGGILIFGRSMGVYGVTIGVVVGAFLNLIIQIPGVIKYGFKFHWPSSWFSPRVKEMIKLSLPRIFGMSVTQLSLIIDTIIASALVTGSIAVINFSSNLKSLPIGLIGISVSVVSFGTLAALAAEKNIEGLAKEITNNLRRILFFLIPMMLGMFTLRFQIVRLLLGRGKFTWTDTILTANTFGVFLSGLAFGGIIFLLARGFYALKNTKTPVIIGIVAVAINIIFSILLARIFKLGTYGLALANSIADILNAVLLMIFLGKQLHSSLLDTKEVLKFIVSGIAMVIVVQLIKSSFGSVFSDIDTYAELIPQTLAATFAGVIVYFGMCRLLKCVDLLELNLPWKKKSPPDV